jgi:hypothetical protein
MPENNNNNSWKRRHAIQIAAQLPEDPFEAIAVLELAKQLVQKFLLDDGRNQPTLVSERSGEIRAFPAATSSR